MRAIARDGSANVGGALIGALANFALIVVIARWWTTDEAGVMFAATSIFLIAMALCHLGVDQALVRFLAWNIGTNTPGANRHLTLWALVPVITVSVLTAALGWLSAHSLTRMLGDLGDGSDSLIIVRILAVTLPIAVLYEEFLAITRGFAHMRPTVTLERILRPSLQVLFVFAAANLAPTVAILALAWAAPYPICLVPAAIAARNTIRSMPREIPAGSRRGAPPEFWRYAAPRGIARLGQISLQRADIVIVSALAGPAAAAIYTSTTRFLVLGQMASSALQQVSEPQLARLLGAGKLSEAAAVVRQMTLWSTLLAVPLYLTIAVHAEMLLRLIFGAEYAEGDTLLLLLSAAMIVGVCFGPLDVLLLMAGRSTLSLINTSVSLAVNILLCFLLVPPLSHLGAGIAWAVAILLRNVMAGVQVWRHLRVTAFTWQQAQWAALLLVLFGGIPWLFSALFSSEWISAASSIIIGFGSLTWAWRNRSKLIKPRETGANSNA